MTICKSLYPYVVLVQLFIRHLSSGLILAVLIALFFACGTCIAEDFDSKELSSIQDFLDRNMAIRPYIETRIKPARSPREMVAIYDELLSKHGDRLNADDTAYLMFSRAELGESEEEKIARYSQIIDQYENKDNAKTDYWVANSIKGKIKELH